MLHHQEAVFNQTEHRDQHAAAETIDENVLFHVRSSLPKSGLGVSGSIDFPTCDNVALHEGPDRIGVIAQSSFDRLGGLVAATQPDDFGGRAVKRRHIRKVCILRNKYEVVSFCVLSD